MRRSLLTTSALAFLTWAAYSAEPAQSLNLAAASRGATVAGPRNASGSRDKPPVANDAR